MVTENYNFLPDEAKEIRIKVFVEEQGYEPFGKQDFDEDCPHQWMKKEI